MDQYITAEQVQEIIDQSVAATESAYGPAGMVALGLLTVLLVFGCVALSAVWWSWRKDRLLLEKIRVEAKEELRENLSVLHAFSDLLNAVKSGQSNLTVFVGKLEKAVSDAEKRILDKIKELPNPLGASE